AGGGTDAGLQDRIEWEQRVAREVHLGDHPLGELSAEQREVDMCRAPGVAVVLPWVRPRLDRGKPVGPVISGQTPADPGEVRVDRRRMLVTFVQVSAAGVGLPDLYQLTAH